MTKPRRASILGCHVERPPPNRVESHDGCLKEARQSRAVTCAQTAQTLFSNHARSAFPEPPLAIDDSNLTTERECRFGCDDAHPS